MASRNLPEMPCGPILELNGQRKRLHVPYGLKPLLEEMSLAVLKDQPDNIYVYLADLLEARVAKKAEEMANNTRRKSWQVHRWSFEASSVLSSHNLQEFLKTLRPSLEEATRCAIIIQKTYRGYHARIVVKEIRRSRGIDLAVLIEVGKTKVLGGEPEILGETETDLVPALVNEVEGEGSVGDQGEEEDNVEVVNVSELPYESSEGENDSYAVAAGGLEEESDFDSQTYEIEDLNDYGNGTATENEEEEVSVVDSNPSDHPTDQEESQKMKMSEDFILLKAPPSTTKDMDEVESKLEPSGQAEEVNPEATGGVE